MYSVVPFESHERRLRDSSTLWPYWSYDVYYFGAQFVLWVTHWTDPQGFKSVSVQMFALLLPSIGVLTVAYHGRAGVKRALYIVVIMECALWAAYWLSTFCKQSPIILFWVLVLSTLSIILFVPYNLVMMDKAAARRLPQERI